MKKKFITVVLILLSMLAVAQTTGARTGGSYILVVANKAGIAKADLPRGDLNVDKILKSELDFSLEFDSGAPDHHTTTVSGKAQSIDGKVYIFSGSETMKDCKLQFTVKGLSTIKLKVLSDKSSCGLSGVDNPEGSYVRYGD